VRSQQRFAAAQTGGKFKDEIVSVEVPGRFAAAHESVCGQTDALTQMRPQRSRQIVIVRQRRKGDGGHVLSVRSLSAVALQIRQGLDPRSWARRDSAQCRPRASTPEHRGHMSTYKALIAGAAGILHVYQLDVGCAFEHLEPDVLRGAGAHARQRQLAKFCARGFDR
jgi:acetyl-CoA acetyltransferase